SSVKPEKQSFPVLFLLLNQLQFPHQGYPERRAVAAPSCTARPAKLMESDRSSGVHGGARVSADHGSYLTAGPPGWWAAGSSEREQPGRSPVTQEGQSHSIALVHVGTREAQREPDVPLGFPAQFDPRDRLDLWIGLDKDLRAAPRERCQSPRRKVCE